MGNAPGAVPAATSQPPARLAVQLPPPQQQAPGQLQQQRRTLPFRVAGSISLGRGPGLACQLCCRPAWAGPGQQGAASARGTAARPCKRCRVGLVAVHSDDPPLAADCRLASGHTHSLDSLRAAGAGTGSAATRPQATLTRRLNAASLTSCAAASSSLHGTGGGSAASVAALEGSRCSRQQ